MNLLQQIESEPVRRPRRMLFYGTRGIGLSTFAATFPESVFVPTDDSLHHVACRRFPVARRFGQVTRALQELYNEPHGYRTVVLDPLDGVERLILDEIRRERGVEHIDAIAFSKGYALALDYWQAILSALDALRDDLGMTCLLIARAQNQRSLDSSAAVSPLLIDRQVPAIHSRASELIQSWCDEVLFATGAESPAGKARDADHTGSRVIHTSPARTHIAKNRLGLPPQMEMDARVFAPYLATAKPSLTSLN